MPFTEIWSKTPEWQKKYRDYCVISALESMLGQIFGHSCVAPEAVYQLRDSQIERSPTIARPSANYDQRIFHEMANAKQNICLLILTWIDADLEMSDYLKALDIEFVDLPYHELERLAASGHAVGVTYVRPRSNWLGYSGHMFHLHRHGLSLSPNDVSDRGWVKKDVRNLIRSGKMTQLVDETRRACGCSALVIPPWC